MSAPVQPAAMPAVDVHAHLAVPAAETLIVGEPGYAEQQAIDAATAGEASVAYNRTQFSQLIPRLTDLDMRLAAMEKAGVDMQAVAPVPQSHAWAGRALAERIVAVTNEAVAGFCAREPGRLLPVGTVALQHPDLAAEQLRHAITALGMRGVQISTAAAPDMELDDPRLADFWAAAEDLGAAVLIHPWGCTGAGPGCPSPPGSLRDQPPGRQSHGAGRPHVPAPADRRALDVGLEAA